MSYLNERTRGHILGGVVSLCGFVHVHVHICVCMCVWLGSYLADVEIGLVSFIIIKRHLLVWLCMNLCTTVQSYAVE